MKPGELAKQTKSVQVNQVVTYIVGKSTSIIVNRTLYPKGRQSFTNSLFYSYWLFKWLTLYQITLSKWWSNAEIKNDK